MIKNLSIFICTINNEIENLFIKSYSGYNLTILNQRPKFLSKKSTLATKKNIRWYDIDNKGLSANRNFAISLIDTNNEFVYLTDDDIIIDKNFNEKFSEVVKKNKDIDIFAFNVKKSNGELKENLNIIKNIGFLSSMKLSSVQLVFRSKVFIDGKIRYDERFGTGAKYKMGEENILLFDLLRKKYKIKYFPIQIGTLMDNESSWFNGFNDKYFFDRGAVFRRMFGHLAIPYSIAFCARKYKIFKYENTFFNSILYCVKGIRDFDKNDKK
ncbi:hypothetical protein ACQV2S_00250 [Facklamia sp. P13064]|uniref:glycosyltransferase family A protein n=1 Tax=Facklamia sp. P13064 TaxID=3421953 RepID=UPI003D16A5CA